MRTALAALGLCLALFTPPVLADWIDTSNAITLGVLRAQGAFDPEWVSREGLSGFDGDVSDLSAGAREAELAVDRQQIARLEKLLAQEQDPRVRQDIRIVTHALQAQITTSDLEYRLLIPYLQLHEMLFRSFNALLDERNDPQRRKAALERLRKYSGRAGGTVPITELAKARSRERFGVPGLLGPYVGQLQTDLDSAAHFVDGIHSLLENSGLTGWEEDYAALATQLDDYNQWLRREILPRARSASRLPPELYADALQNYGVDATPEELIEVAQYSYQQLYMQMSAVARQVAAQRGWKDPHLRAVLTALRAEQIAPEKVLPLYQQRLAEVEGIIRRENLVSLPQRPAKIRLATEAESASIPAPFMNPPQLIGNTGQYGEFVLVQNNPALGDESRMDDFSYDAITWTLVVHEARPGHELQFDRMVERGVSLARAIYAFNSANAEGWALYAESIMQSYLPLDGQLMSLYARAWRAARMFLDPMVNTGKLSRDGARDFLMRELLFSEPMASSEADRYAFRAPGQATSYYYGYMALMRLRTELVVDLGDAFDQRAFHDFILDQGLLPPDLMREAVLQKFVP